LTLGSFSRSRGATSGAGEPELDGEPEVDGSQKWMGARIGWEPEFDGEPKME